MNKKGEIISLGILLIILAIGIIYYGFSVDDRNYVGDIKMNTVYNLKSNNTNCNLNEIKIERDNMKLFKTKEEALSQGFKLSNECP